MDCRDNRNLYPATVSVISDRYSRDIPVDNRQQYYSIVRSPETGIADYQIQRQLYCSRNIYGRRQKYIVYITGIDKQFGRIDDCGSTVDCIIP